MKTLKLRNLNPVNWLLLSALLLGAAWLYRTQTTVTAQVRGGGETFIGKPPFVIRNYGGKCLDFGPAPQVSGAPVFINRCNGTSAQQVHIEEINAQHDVILRAGNKVIGVRSQLVNTTGRGVATATQAETETPLELQNEASRNTIYAQGQIFALDGDSIMLASARNRVVEAQNARGANRTPLALGRRELADAELWTFTAADGSGRRPTSGFVRISQSDNSADGELRARADFLHAVFGAKWGTVIELDANVSINLTDTPTLQIPAGVTIRGDRRGIRLGPQLRGGPNIDGTLRIIGNDVRITGLRLLGPSRSTDESTVLAAGILVQDFYLRSNIDHNEMSDWPEAAVIVQGDDLSESCQIREGPVYQARPENVRVARNFIHHNHRQAQGYGVGIRYSGYALIEGNTFVSNRHAISGDGRSRTGYSAQLNLVLAASPYSSRP